eukprot:CAMPEP_0176311528 /NCGR_PEP_ID=MMETSP0121_2-20121125/66190_1 /TAXON_ID=160619 /ORGANISM="Kryptoperidinium foliaceum, Strain CCMP 1326" /LENGTH=146 /DNA_ID=CAMNT_0017653563 /DNA_START=21 /DNA_END=457 /DNA_ORIENTATION=-
MGHIRRFEVSSTEDFFEDCEIDIWPLPAAPTTAPQWGGRRPHCGCLPEEPLGLPGRHGLRDVNIAGYPHGIGGASMGRESRSYEQHHTVMMGMGGIAPAGLGGISARPPPGLEGVAGPRGGAIASRGSAGHASGDCVPCKYLRSKR